MRNIFVNKMVVILSILFLSVSRPAYGLVNNVRLVDHEGYVTKVLQETMNEIENREWCNLKIPDISQYINDTIYTWHIEGDVTYTNGFLVGLDSMELLQSSIQQIWTYLATEDINQVTLRADLRLNDLALGFDVVANMNEGRSRFTGKYTHQNVVMRFNIVKNMNTTEIVITSSIQSLSGGRNRIIYMPENRLSEVLSRHHVPSSTWEGISGWLRDDFVPVMVDVVDNKIEFPALCYNC